MWMAGPTLRSNHNVVFHCAFHVVWAPKYRRPVLVSPVDARLKVVLIEVIEAQGARHQAIEVMPDHVHLLIEVDPQFGVHRLVKALKARSSHALRQEFPHLRRRLPTLWTNSYFVATTGRAPLAAIERYVEQQKYV
jgi:putative transposase